jgi:hypothetical protein
MQLQYLSYFVSNTDIFSFISESQISPKFKIKNFKYFQSCFSEIFVQNKNCLNFSLQDKTRAKFSTLEAPVCMLCTCVTIKQNGLTSS